MDPKLDDTLSPVQRAILLLQRARRLGTEEAKAEADLALAGMSRAQLREVLSRTEQPSAFRARGRRGEEATPT
ncbi:hypothetical protein SAMN05444161_0003 [Rhizobiales bacterium GAS191]|nr:hypothetical protein SAMN05444161_0003 [Rhizobiales bacterium GAS191]